MKVKVKVDQLCLTLCNSMDYTVHGILQARIYIYIYIYIMTGSLKFVLEPMPTQEWNQGLLHCRQILYHLSYQGSPGRNTDGKQMNKYIHIITSGKADSSKRGRGRGGILEA